MISIVASQKNKKDKKSHLRCVSPAAPVQEDLESSRFEAYKGRHDWYLAAKTLSEGLATLNQYVDETFVIRFSTNLLENQDLARSFAKDLVLLKDSGVNVVLVHDAGQDLYKLVDGLLATDGTLFESATPDQVAINIIEMILSGHINKRIVQLINEAGGSAIGLSGKDGKLLEAKKIRCTQKDPSSNVETILNFNFFGEVDEVNSELITSFEEQDVIPVIAPLGVDSTGQTMHLNADNVAAAIASEMDASKLIIISDKEEILKPGQNAGCEIAISTIFELMQENHIKEGFLPAIESAIEALEGDVDAVHFIDGTIPHALILELLSSEGVGVTLKVA